MNYLAAPYHHDDPKIRAERLRLIDSAMHELFPRRVFSPISHNAPSSETYGAQHPSDYLLFDFEILSNCTGLYILTLSGWNRSRGVLLEIGYAISKNLSLHIIRRINDKWMTSQLQVPDLLDLLYKD